MSRNGTAGENQSISALRRAHGTGLFRDTAETGDAAVVVDGSRLYVGAVVLAGCAVLSGALMEISAAPLPVEWWVLVGLTLLLIYWQ